MFFQYVFVLALCVEVFTTDKKIDWVAFDWTSIGNQTHADTQDEEISLGLNLLWRRFLVMCAIITYLGSSVKYFDPLLKQRWLLNNYVRGVGSKQHLAFGWGLHIADVISTVAMLILGSLFVAEAESIKDVVLNTVALEYILEVGDWGRGGGG